MKNTNTNPQLGAALKAARLANGLEQVEVADRIGIDRSWIASIETGRIGRPGRDRLIELAHIYAVDPDIFLRLAGHKTINEAPRSRRLSDITLEFLITLKKLERDIEEDDSPNNPARRELVEAARIVTRVPVLV